jgi:hypothetical protein
LGERGGIPPIGWGTEEDRLRQEQLAHLRERFLDLRRGETRLVVGGQVVAAHSPQDLPEEGAAAERRGHARIVADEQALLVLRAERLGGRDQLVDGGRGLHAGLVQDALAVVQHPHVVDHLDLVDLAVHGRGLDVRLGVVTLGVADDVVQGDDLAALDLVDVDAALEHVRSRGRQQTRVELGGVVARRPLHLHRGVGVLLGVPRHRLLGAGFPVLVVPDVERRL